MTAPDPVLDPRSAQDFERAVRIQQEGGRPRKAARIYQALLRRVPEHYPSLLNLGVLRFEAGKVEEAVRLFQRAEARRPNAPELHFNLGKALRALGDRRAAQRHLEVAYEYSPDDLPAMEELGALYLETERTAAAAALAAHAADRHPDHPQPVLLRAHVHMVQGEFDDAHALLDAVLVRWPDCHQAFALQAEVRFQQGDADRALLAIRRALLIQPAVGGYLRQQGIYQGSAGDHRGARLSFRRARALSPRLRVPPDVEAPEADEARAEEEAERLWARLKLQAALLERARGYAQEERWKAGVADFLTLTGKYPGEPVVWQELAGFYEHLNEPRRAATLYRKALDLDPGNLEAAVRAARLEVRFGELERAAALLGGLDPDERELAPVLEVEGELHLAQGKPASARRAFERCLDRMPNEVGALAGLGDCHLAEGDPEAARTAWTRAFRAEPSDRVVAGKLAEVLIEMGRGPDADKVLEACVERNPGDLQLRIRLARRYLDGRRASAAARVYKEVMLGGRPARAEAGLDYLEALVFSRRTRLARKVAKALARHRPTGMEGGRLALLEAAQALVDHDENRFSLAWQRAWREDRGLVRHAPYLAGMLRPDEVEHLRTQVARMRTLFAGDADLVAGQEALVQGLFPAVVRTEAGGAAGRP